MSGRLKILICGMMVVVLAGLLSANKAQALNYQPVDFSAYYNDQYVEVNGHTYPTGSQTYLGVPFQLSNDHWFWTARYISKPNPITLELNVNIQGAREVHTLISTYWGEKSPGTYAYIEFFGTGGAYYKKDLDGNDDIRDYNYNPSYTTSINGITTVQVWDNGSGQHLDKQFFDLPAAFDHETLTKIILADNGGEYFQRVILFGLTVGYDVCPVPVPGTLLLLGSVLVPLALLKQRRRN